MSPQWLSKFSPNPRQKARLQQEIPEGTGPVTFAILSDLHLETPTTRPTYDDFTFSSSARHLALLGDIGSTSHDGLFSFLTTQLQHFEKVFYVLGNHEPYNSSYAVARQRLAGFAARSEGRFVLLDQTRFDVSATVTVLGCTLYSAIEGAQAEAVKMFISDFECIEDWDVDQHNAAHSADVAWLNEQVRHIARTEPERRVAIFTHYAPTVQAQAHDARHLRDDSGVRSAFMTDLSQEDCWRSPGVKLWAFGHTHHNSDFIDEGTGKRMLANQKGYRRSEAVDFEAAKVIGIG